ncbi:hypothetical protein B566_EDAN010332 [Ephemera danica]|nr:hypothetical protein B566_EDAN010332 [Ephemera danica]
MSDQETTVIQDDAAICESYEEEMAKSQSELINFAGRKLEQLISTDVENFTEEALVLCKIATSHVVPKQKSQEQLANAVQRLRTQVKDDISKFTEEVQSIG